MSDQRSGELYRLSKLEYNRQRVENANFDLHKLKEVNLSKYPNLTRTLDAHGGAKRNRLRQILEYLTDPAEHSFILDNDPEHKPYTDIPIKELTGKHGGNPATYQSLFNLLCVCGLIEKHNPNTYDQEHRTQLDREARKHAERERGRRRLRHRNEYSARVYYHLPMWTDELLQRAEALANKRTGTLTQVIDVYGADQARKALDTARGIPHDTQRARERIDAFVLEALTLRGYVTKSQIMRGVHVLTTAELTRRQRIKEGKKVKPYSGRKTVNLEPILTAYIPELCKRYDLTYKQPTKDQIREYQLQNRSWIITRRSAPQSARGGADHKGR